MFRTPISNLNLFEIVSGSENFTTFVIAAKATGLDAILKNEGMITVFAPSNAAFAALPPGALQTLLLPENHEALRRILAYHIVPRRLTSTQIIPGRVATVQGEPLEFIASERGTLTIQGARVIQSDVAGRNGIIHAINKVLAPKSVVIENYATQTASANSR